LYKIGAVTNRFLATKKIKNGSLKINGLIAEIEPDDEQKTTRPCLGVRNTGWAPLIAGKTTSRRMNFKSQKSFQNKIVLLNSTKWQMLFCCH